MQKLLKKTGIITTLVVCLMAALPSYAETLPPVPVPAYKPAPPIYMQRPSAPNGARLSAEDIQAYQTIYSLQADGKMKEADAYYKELTDNRLLGHMLYQRYMHPAYRSGFIELKSWLDIYSDHPNASDIYRLAVRKKPKSFAGQLKRPAKATRIASVAEPTMEAAKIYAGSPSRTRAQRNEAASLKKTIRYQIKTSQITRAVNKIKALEKGSVLDKVEIDELKGRLSSSYLYGGYLPEAKSTAQAAVKRSGAHVPEAAWVAGLVAWYEGEYQIADDYFEIAATSPYASGWARAAAAYWAARTHMRLGNFSEVSIWLNQAAAHPRTFYGLMATRWLGQDFEFNWSMPQFTMQDYEILAHIPAGSRAMALVAIGQKDLAEAELLRLSSKDQELRQAMLAYAHKADLPALALRLGGVLSRNEPIPFDAALYPVGHWQPEGGYKLSQELIHAIVRQESRFDPSAQSTSGARGLMQIMPATAKHISKRSGIKIRSEESLGDPSVNLALGQAYIGELLQNSAVSDDLTSLLIAYNAGPGNLARWQKRWPTVDDPLLFIELLPSSQTREYVEKVLANFWIYRMRAGEPTTTLSSLSSGKRALYAQLSERPKIRVAASYTEPAEVNRSYKPVYND